MSEAPPRGALEGKGLGHSGGQKWVKRADNCVWKVLPGVLAQWFGNTFCLPVDCGTAGPLKAGEVQAPLEPGLDRFGPQKGQLLAWVWEVVATETGSGKVFQTKALGRPAGLGSGTRKCAVPTAIPCHNDWGPQSGAHGRGRKC